MPLYLIRRDADPGSSDEELESGAFRAFCFTFLYENMRWVTSYRDAEASRYYCIYEADNEEQLREHARRARIPCDEIRQISVVGPEKYVGEIGEALEEVALLQT